LIEDRGISGVLKKQTKLFPQVSQTQRSNGKVAKRQSGCSMIQNGFDFHFSSSETQQFSDLHSIDCSISLITTKSPNFSDMHSIERANHSIFI